MRSLTCSQIALRARREPTALYETERRRQMSSRNGSSSAAPDENSRQSTSVRRGGRMSYSCVIDVGSQRIDDNLIKVRTFIESETMCIGHFRPLLV